MTLSPRQKAQSAQASMFEAFALGEPAARVGELPDTLEAGAVALRTVIERFNAAMLAGDEKAWTQAEGDAQAIAAALNGGTTFGICAGDDRSGNKLETMTAAPAGTVPIHGQAGEFVLAMDGYSVRVEVDGMFGCAHGFEIHSLDGKACPISETGYRSFAGAGYGGCGGLEVEPFIRAVIAAHLKPAPKKAKRKKGEPKPEDT